MTVKIITHGPAEIQAAVARLEADIESKGTVTDLTPTLRSSVQAQAIRKRAEAVARFDLAESLRVLTERTRDQAFHLEREADALDDRLRGLA